MAKYIIDIPDDSDTKYTYDQDTKELKFPSPRIDFTNLMGLEIVLKNVIPYTESDRNAIEDEVWEFAKKLVSMSGNEVSDMMGCATNFGEVMYNMPYQESKNRYEKWKKQKDEIRVGDELKDDGNIRAVVLDIRDEDYMSYEVFTENGIMDEWQRGIVVKTGRHFDEVEELLKKMREGEE